MCAKSSTDGAGGCGAGVIPSSVSLCTPAACSGLSALEGVVAKLVAVVALGVWAKAQAALKAKGGGEGREAWKDCKVLCLGASDGDDDGGGCFSKASWCSGEPPGLLCKHEPGVEGCKFFADVGKRVGGRDAVHKELCRGSVQMDGGGARDKVEELGDLAVKRGRPNRVHGGEK